MLTDNSIEIIFVKLLKYVIRITKLWWKIVKIFPVQGKRNFFGNKEVKIIILICGFLISSSFHMAVAQTKMCVLLVSNDTLTDSQNIITR